jgi:multidrug efflux pump subunit AcrA (membrane-fusion protein)
VVNRGEPVAGAGRNLAVTERDDMKGVMKGVRRTAATGAALTWCAVSWWVVSWCGAVAAAAEPGEPVLERCLVSLVEEAKVPAREPGVLVELRIREGDRVGRDDMIARIDDSQPQSERRRAKAEHDQTLAKAESDVDVRYAVAAEKVAEAEFAKAAESDRKVPGSVTQVERDRLKLNEKKSELQIEQAELERKLAALAAQA